MKKNLKRINKFRPSILSLIALLVLFSLTSCVCQHKPTPSEPPLKKNLTPEPTPITEEMIENVSKQANSLNIEPLKNLARILEDLKAGKEVPAIEKNEGIGHALGSFDDSKLWEALIDRGANVIDLQQQLYHYARDGRLEQVKFLFNTLGADVNSRYDSSKTLLIELASFSSREEIIKILLANPRTDINAIDINGNTALHMASLHNNLSNVQLLLTRKDIDINIKNKEGKKPVDIAKEPAITALLQKS